MYKTIVAVAVGVAGFALAAPAAQAEIQEFKLVIKNHQFTPAELTIPADKKVKLIVSNEDATPEEFESYELHREKVIPGNSKATIFIGPLDAGTYAYIGEFNEKTAKGKIIAK